MKTSDLQNALARLALYNGEIDNMVGRQTLAGSITFLKKRGVDPSKWTAPRIIVAAKQQVCKDAGLEAGTIDGLVGPQTMYAFEQFERIVILKEAPETWRDEEEPKPLPVQPASVKNVWPRQKEVPSFFGAVGKNQTMLTLPFPMKLAWDMATTVTRISLHQKVAPSASRVFNKVLSRYGHDQIINLRLNRFGGALNVRKMRGGTNYSMHSWGIAIDFDPDRNQLKWGRDKAFLDNSEYEPFWKFWEEEGWVSLGRVKNYDWMHVQAARL